MWPNHGTAPAHPESRHTIRIHLKSSKNKLRTVPACQYEGSLRQRVRCRILYVKERRERRFRPRRYHHGLSPKIRQLPKSPFAKQLALFSFFLPSTSLLDQHRTSLHPSIAHLQSNFSTPLDKDLSTSRTLCFHHIAVATFTRVTNPTLDPGF